MATVPAESGPARAWHATRLFPKFSGAAAYALTGVAARCDWALLSDTRPPHTHLRQLRTTDSPRHVFLSLRNPFAALAAFATEVLPRLRAPFVLVSGSEDCTLPHQRDQRWRSFDATEQGYIRTILESPLLIRWVAENLDDASDRRFVPLPTGMVYPAGPPVAAPAPNPPPQQGRVLRVLVGHRVRTGPQWELRRTVTALATQDWAGFCTLPEGELPEPAFLALMDQHAFVLCAEGGGLDPSPKAWQAILQGAIPIIRKTATHAAYAQLPVAFVEDWTRDSLTPERLAAWHSALAPFYDTPALRAQTLERLGADYWWQQIAALARA